MNSEMVTCSYCGQANDEQSPACKGCGLILRAEQREDPSFALGERELILNGRSATIIFLTYYGIQLFSGFVFGFLGSASAMQRGLDPMENVQRQVPMITASGALIALFWLLFISSRLIPHQLRNVDSTGAAWVPGRAQSIVAGLVMGVILGACFILAIAVFQNQISREKWGPLTKMALSPGASQIFWIVLALMVAPISEELSFRGVLYGGFRKSFGPVLAAALVTFVFVALHLSEALHSMTAIIFISILSLSAIWMRLRYQAIGPPIALHFGYNAVIVLTVLARTMK